MPARLPLTADALAASARDAAGDGTRAAIAACLLSGRAVATVVSSLTGDEITVQAKCKARLDGKWRMVPYEQADVVYLDVPLADGGPGGYQIGSFYPSGNKAGLFFYATNADRARVEAAKHVLLAAVGQAERDDEILPATRCTRCGRELRRRDSITGMIGPECADKVEPYLNSHQAPGETFFADQVEPLPGRLLDAQAAAIDADPGPDRAPLDGIDAVVAQEDEREARRAQARPPAPEPARAADGAPEGLIRLPAGADPRQVLQGLS